jgi:CHAD domain-containing protein
MSYRYRIEDSVEANISRIIAEQIDRALFDLTPSGMQHHDGIHQARKRFKKIRSALRLARPALGDWYGRGNDLFRSAGRKLSGLRDLQAMIDTCDSLHRYYQRQVKSALFAPIRAALVADLDTASRHEGALMQAAEEVAGMLREARDHLSGVSFEAEGFEAIGGGLIREYKRGVKSFAAARAQPSDDRYHQWRKRAKDYWYHMRLLRDMWPRIINGYRKAADELSHLLGDDHDLAVLHDRIAQQPELLSRPRDRAMFDELIGMRQAELRAQALPLGMRLYAETPSAARKRYEIYWQAWSGS